jgi:outer membrane protein assembly factor BamB
VSKLYRILLAHRAIVAVAAVLVAVTAVVAGVLYLESKQSRLTVGAGAQTEPAPAAPKPSAFVWPTFGYDSARTHNVPRDLSPPFRQLWRARPTGKLLEFTPSLGEGSLYAIDNLARATAISARTGRTVWKRRLGALAASTPTYDSGRLYFTVLCTAACTPSIGGSRSNGRGRVAALRARDGKVLWSRTLPSRSESTPLVLGGRLYFGSEDGTVYAMRTGNGRIDWKYRAGDAVKGALAYENGRLYFGDYTGSVNAVRARDGKLVWTRSNVTSEKFYATPAVGFGRVFLSTTDGYVHALRTNGHLDWSFQAGPGGYFYSAPALGKPPGLGPTVFIGSHDGNFYALDARSGRVRWKKAARGPILGSATIVGDTVYFSTLAARMTYGVRTRDGKDQFHRGQGAFDPAIADERHLYLIGYSTITALEPKAGGEGAGGGAGDGARDHRGRSTRSP